MDHLSGWTVAVTAHHRAAEQAALLQRRGADVLLTPLVRATPVDDAVIRAATVELVAAPLDAFVATTAVGLRSWLAMAWTWDLGHTVLDALQRTTLVPRGAATVGVLVGEGIEVPLEPPATTLREVLDRLLVRGVNGWRIGVQLPGRDTQWFAHALRAGGATVVEIPVYDVGTVAGGAAADRLASALERGEVDAVTCTSAAAAEALVSIRGAVDALLASGTVCACMGSGSEQVLRHAGVTEVVVPSPNRLGTLVRALGERLAHRGRTIDVAGVELRHQGARIEVDGHEVRLTPRERRVLEVMLDAPGVLSKERLAALAWDAEVDGHTVEVAINRLRRKLGPAALALETTNRRGYRIAR